MAPKPPQKPLETKSSPVVRSVLIGTPIPWEDTPPNQLALPWTSVPPVATSTSIAIVNLDQNTILLAVNRGDFRSAVTIPSVTGFRIERGMFSGDLVDRLFVTCNNGSEEWVGWFAAIKNWNSIEHPRTYINFPLSEPNEVCSSPSGSN